MFLNACSLRSFTKLALILPFQINKTFQRLRQSTIGFKIKQSNVNLHRLILSRLPKVEDFHQFLMLKKCLTFVLEYRLDHAEPILQFHWPVSPKRNVKQKYHTTIKMIVKFIPKVLAVRTFWSITLEVKKI